MTKQIIFIALASVAGLSFSTNAFAFPEMIRHGYVNCTSCHVSPSGGGALTSYGRQLSGELLSTWSAENEGQVLWNAVPMPKWLAIGGDARGVEIYRSTPQVSQIRSVFMQADLEAAYHTEKLTVDASAGIYQSMLEARRFYVMGQLTDETSLRFGKFNQNFGIMQPAHISPTKRALGLDEGDETYNLELAYLGERVSLFVTGVFGRPDDLNKDLDKGFSLRPAVNFHDTYQLGLSYFHGAKTSATRDVIGPFAALGFTKHFYLLSELDFQILRPTGLDTQNGFVNYQKLGYEVIQGLHLYAVQQISHLNFGDASSIATGWGFGTQFFPRPHFEFDLEFQRQQTPAFPTDTTDYVTLLGHFYM